MFNFFDVISEGIVSFFMASLIAVSGLVSHQRPVPTPIQTITPTPTIQAANLITPTPVIIPSGRKSVNKTSATATPTPTTIPPTSTPQPTYACEIESGIKYSTSPCEQQSQKRGKSTWSGGCNSGTNQNLSLDTKLTYNLLRTTLTETLPGKAYIEIKKINGDTVFPKQEIQGSGELPVKEFVKEGGQYSITLEQIGVDANGYGLCSNHTITLEY